MYSLLEPVIIKNDVQQYCVEIMKRLDCQRINEHLCDVTLEVGSGEDQARLKAHRNVLCAASPFFYNALITEMKEKKEGVIRLKDTTKVLMEQVLEYLYTGHVEFVNDKNAHELLALADFLLITSLKFVSSAFIQETLCVSNCIFAYYSSVKYQCSELQEAARRFILAHFIAVTESADFLNLSLEEVEQWISSDEIVVKGEEEVFSVILRWISKGSRRKQSFFELFSHVRFIYVSHNYLVTVILQHPLVKSKKRCLDCVLNAMKDISDGTEVCFLNQPPRHCLNTHESAVFACGGPGGNKTMCYVPSKNKWYSMVQRVSIRNPFGLDVSAFQGKLYVIGGGKREVERYDPLLNSWASVKSLKEKIQFASAVTFQGYLYVIGGVDTDNDNERLNSVCRYNPDANMWQEVAPLPKPRSSFCAVADEKNIYVIGGLRSSGESGVLTKVVEKLNLEENCWKRTAPTQEERRSPGGVNFRNQIFVFGGLRNSNSNGYSCEKYDKDMNIWSAISSPVFAPGHPPSAVCFNGQIFVFGKFQSDQSDRQNATLRVYDVDSNEWKPCQNVSYDIPSFKLSAGRILKEVLEFCEEILEP